MKKFISYVILFLVLCTNYLSASDPGDRATKVIAHLKNYSNKNLETALKNKNVSTLSSTNLDSSYQWNASSTGPFITPSIIAKKEIFTYDSQNNVLTYDNYSPNGASFHIERTVYSYDLNNRLLIKEFLNKQDTDLTWFAYQRDTFYYDVNSNVSSMHEIVPDTLGWQDEAYIGYLYDSSNRIIMDSAIYDFAGPYVIAKNIYTYDLAGRLESHSYLESPDYINLVNVSKHIYSYNFNNDLETDISQTSTNGTTWENDYRKTYLYDINNRLNGMSGATWSSSSWMYTGHMQSYFNSVGNKSRDLYWDANGDSTFQQLFSYDSANNLYKKRRQDVYSYLQVIPGWAEFGDSTVNYYHNGSAPSCASHYNLIPDTIPHNWFALYQTGGLAPYEFIWQWGDGFESHSANASHVYATPGFYNICLYITDANNCTSSYCDSSVYISKGNNNLAVINITTVNSLTGLNEVEKNPFNVYPDPIQDVLTIESSSITNNNSFEIFNLLGEKVHAMEKLVDYKSSINVSTLQSGVYLIKFNSLNGNVIKRFIKE